MFSIDKTEQAYFPFRETSTKIQFLLISLSSYRSIEFNYDAAVAAVIERNNFGCVMKIIVIELRICAPRFLDRSL